MKLIALCECRRSGGQAIARESSRRVVPATKDGFCALCRYAVYYKRVEDNWEPSMGVTGVDEYVRHRVPTINNHPLTY